MCAGEFDQRPRECRGKIVWCALAIATTFAGCTTPQAQFVGSPQSALQVPNPTPVAEQRAPAESSVVRFQNPGDPYTAGSDDSFRAPMNPSTPTETPSAWGQYQPPVNQNAWGTYPPPSAAPSWGNPAASSLQNPPVGQTPMPPGTQPPNGTLWNGAATGQPAPPWNGTYSAANPTAYPVSQVQAAQWATPVPPQGFPAAVPPLGAAAGAPGILPPPNLSALGPPATAPLPGVMGVRTPLTDVYVNAAQAQTGRLLVGAAVNSDAGLTGQIIIDEKNFDWRRWPRGWGDLPNAFRGGGQGFRIEALPGSEVQRYMVQFTEPYLLDTRVSFNVSGFVFDRRYFDWDEERLGGRFGFGYRVTPDLSVQASVRVEDVKIKDPRVPGVPALDGAVGDNELYGIRFGITQDTRDIPFAPTQGYYLDLSYEQVFGTFDYPRATVDYRRYFLVTERPDGSGRHVLGFGSRISVSGSQTPIYDNFFAGGYSTLRGFEFRGATPKVDGVAVGGELSLLGSVEYRFPITADDMLQAVVFCDYGTVEEEIKIDYDDYRVAFGAGLRVAIPALSAAPIALDFSFPVAREDTDDIQNFAFFVGVSR